MFLRSRMCCLAAAAGLLVASGCATTSKALPKVRSTVTLELTPHDRAVLAAIMVNDALKVVLPPPADGPKYTWEIVANNTKYLQQISPLKTDPTGAATVTFEALHYGRSILRFAAVRPGQLESEPTDLYQITVGVKSPGD